MTISNDLGKIVVDSASIAAGSLAPVNGGHVFHNPPSFMNNDHNIRVKADNQTTIEHISNITSASGVPRQKVQDKSLISVFTTNRGNINPAMETQINIKGPNTTKQFSYIDGARTTNKETTLYSWSGIATNNVLGHTVQDYYTLKDGTGGLTSLPTGKDPIMGYIPSGSRITGNMTQVPVGEINFKELDNDKIRTTGPGTLHQAVPELSRINPVLKEQTGTVQFNPNKIKHEDHTRTDSVLIDGLLKNGFSVYNNCKENELVYPSFTSNSSHSSDHSFYKNTTIKKEEIPIRNIPRAIPVYNSQRNGNEIIVRNVTSGNTENPLLFTKRELKSDYVQPSNFNPFTAMFY